MERPSFREFRLVINAHTVCVVAHTRTVLSRRITGSFISTLSVGIDAKTQSGPAAVRGVHAGNGPGIVGVSKKNGVGTVEVFSTHNQNLFSFSETTAKHVVGHGL